MKGNNRIYIKNPTKCEKKGIIMGMTKKRKRDKIVMDMKHEYEDIVSTLTLPETIAQSL